jgi:hypothetical protein
MAQGDAAAIRFAAATKANRGFDSNEINFLKRKKRTGDLKRRRHPHSFGMYKITYQYQRACLLQKRQHHITSGRSDNLT